MRSHYCNEVTENCIGAVVKLAGWVSHLRCLGELVFLTIRDRTGELQCLANLATDDLRKQTAQLTVESCVYLEGCVVERPPSQRRANANLEVHITQLKCLSRAKPLPMHNRALSQVETRLQYRYLDLRRPEVIERFKQRSRIAAYLRQAFINGGFIEVETPCLTKATPEGARDFLVPSRVHPHHAYALPQSPQLFKQLLMIGGVDRYFQIVKCFRDEDLRSDRQPEFTQVDVEVSFMPAKALRNWIEKTVQGLFKSVLNIDLPNFPVLTHTEAMHRYGSDKPDMRFGLEIQDVTAIFESSGIGALGSKTNEHVDWFVGGIVLPRALTQTEQAKLRAQVEMSTTLCFARRVQNQENAWTWVAGEKPILNGEAALHLQTLTNATEEGELLLLAGGKSHTLVTLGNLRLQLGQSLNLIDPSHFAPLWVVDFPLFEQTPEGLSAAHHPFTAPKSASVDELVNDPLKVVADAYDLVLNGYEIGGGSVRIIDPVMQSAVFSLLQLSESAQQEKFGFLLEALQFGPPPHAGIALGLDRLVMLMTHSSNLREVIAFPKTSSANCPLTGAPTIPEPEALALLGLALAKE